MNSKNVMDYVTETVSSNLDEVKARCESTESFTQQNREMLATSMEERIDTVTTHVDEKLLANETGVKELVETRLQAHDAVIEATLDAVERRVSKRVCTSVLRNIFGAILQVQNTNRVLEAFNLTQALCDVAANEGPYGEDDGYDEWLQPCKKLSLIHI